MKKQYYFLVSGAVVFSIGDSEEAHNVTLNTIVTHDTNLIPARVIGQAQKGLQMRLHQIVQEADTVVRSVTILNICRLGQMSKADFEQLPKDIVPEPVMATEIGKNPFNV